MGKYDPRNYLGRGINALGNVTHMGPDQSEKTSFIGPKLSTSTKKSVNYPSNFIGPKNTTDNLTTQNNQNTQSTQSTSDNSQAATGGSTFSPISAPNMQDLEEKAFNLVKPYYIQLAKEANGDFTRAKQILQEDYTKGTRLAREQAAIKTDRENQDLRATLTSLGITNVNEQEDAIDKLNNRGMAVTQMNPDRTFNALGVSLPIANPNNPTSPISNPANPVLGGRGAVELNRLQSDQQLRQEAKQRASARNIQDIGIDLRKYTNPVADINNPNADRSQFGEAELNLVRGNEDLARQQQLKLQNLAERRRQDVFDIANQTAKQGVSEIPNYLTNQSLQKEQTNFVNQGV